LFKPHSISCATFWDIRKLATPQHTYFGPRTTQITVNTKRNTRNGNSNFHIGQVGML